MSRSKPKLHSRLPRIHNINFDQLQLGNNYVIEINNHYGKRYYYGEIFAKSGPDPQADIDGRIYFRNLVKLIRFPNIGDSEPLDRDDLAQFIENLSVYWVQRNPPYWNFMLDDTVEPRLIRPTNEYVVDYVREFMEIYSVDSRDNIGMGRKRRKSNKKRKQKLKTRRKRRNRKNRRKSRKY
jgi:hypothetical protein